MFVFEYLMVLVDADEHETVSIEDEEDTGGARRRPEYRREQRTE